MFANIPPVTRNIIILNVVIYLVSNFLFSGYLYDILSAYYPFSPNFKSWQVLTHMFMHSPLSGGVGLTHILFNMLTLWSFGPVLERFLAEKRFVILYFASGLGAFLLFNIWNFIQIQGLVSEIDAAGLDVSEIFRKSAMDYHGDQSIFQNPLALELGQMLNAKMLGASGAIFGVVAAFSTLFPNAKLMFMFVPFPVKAKYLLPIIILISLYLGFSGKMGDIAHFAHIGGALVGFLLAKYWKKGKMMYHL
ncbi:MAG: rhomboid family intramembrane serine protease [Bergeyella zoohelcum]|nr:rhomboid family intramembrane serine protease [Bergeyella zoohelcum]